MKTSAARDHVRAKDTERILALNLAPHLQAKKHRCFGHSLPICSSVQGRHLALPTTTQFNAHVRASCMTDARRERRTECRIMQRTACQHNRAAVRWREHRPTQRARCWSCSVALPTPCTFFALTTEHPCRVLCQALKTLRLPPYLDSELVRRRAAR